MTTTAYATARREYLKVLVDARKVQEAAREKNSDKAKFLTAEVIGRALESLVTLRARYYGGRNA